MDAVNLRRSRIWLGSEFCCGRGDANGVLSSRMGPVAKDLNNDASRPRKLSEWLSIDRLCVADDLLTKLVFGVLNTADVLVKSTLTLRPKCLDK